jgi:hypothetical protein
MMWDHPPSRHPFPARAVIEKNSLIRRSTYPLTKRRITLLNVFMPPYGQDQTSKFQPLIEFF